MTWLVVDRLMTDGLGYPRYVAHGRICAGITARLARPIPEHVAGILATPGLRRRRNLR
jgi:hypothetical protein